MELLKLIGIASGSAAIVSGIIGFLFKQWIEHERNLSLEKFKAGIIQQQTALSTSINSQVQASHAVSDHRIDALMEYWSDFSRISEFTRSSNGSERFLLDREIDEILNGKVMALDPTDWILKEHDPVQVELALDQAAAEIGRLRPLIGEQLWYYHLTFRLFSGRISLLYSLRHSLTKWETWKKDQALVRILRQALTNEEADRILQEDLGSINIACDILEQKVLGIIGRILSGEIASSSTLGNAKRLTELIRAVPTK